MFGDKDGDALNPFEVREVLQAMATGTPCLFLLSIPLKSGKCCKYHGLGQGKRQQLSIPLKSGKCCKSALQNFLIKINKLFVSFR